MTLSVLSLGGHKLIIILLLLYSSTISQIKIRKSENLGKGLDLEFSCAAQHAYVDQVVRLGLRVLTYQGLVVMPIGLDL